ncbi:PDZ domain-containing protein [Aridibaculum aurantiacum]|uniref:PDZ domain-containing protein n=1 Tax=Aridibaculum aurantiacum TaxID=2810307 RepID=UPI001A95F6B4|nr:PDZ domain-containing protein [Aridibaculum aurantiacum]
MTKTNIMITWKKIAACTLALAVAGTAGFAQTKSGTEKKKKEQIIIQKDGDKNEKMTIVVDGDNVTINGKPLEEWKDSDITVLQGTDLGAFAPGARAFSNPHINGGRAREIMNGTVATRGNRAILGVVTEKADDGAKITSVTPESGADKAGLKKDDVITKVGDKKIESSNDLIAAIGTHKPNDKVDITYKRGGKEAKATATLGENKTRSLSYNFDGNMAIPNVPFPEAFGFGSRKPRIGMQIQDVEEGTGVKVREVDPESPAAKAGFKEGDVITEVNGKAIAGVDVMRDQIKDIKEGDVLKMSFNRSGSKQTAEVKIPKRLKVADL